MTTLEVDRYVLDTLMTELVGRDRRPGAYVLYLALCRLCAGRHEVTMSLQGLAEATGLSKAAVQRSVAHLARRRLIAVRSTGRNQAPHYVVLKPWQR